MALALSFAGNDLVNFIGVFMAGQSSMEIATQQRRGRTLPLCPWAV